MDGKLARCLCTAHFTFPKGLFGSQHVHSSKARFNVTLRNTNKIDINNVRTCVISVIGQFRYEVTNESAQRLHVVK